MQSDKRRMEPIAPQLQKEIAKKTEEHFRDEGIRAHDKENS